LAISPSTKDDLVARGIAPSNVWVVPPGVDLVVYRLSGTLDEREPIVVWVGRLEPYKRADVMIKAMLRVIEDRPDARLIIIGEGSDHGSLETMVEAAGIKEAVSFTGFVEEAEKVAWYRRAAAVVNTSEKEGWGMTMIEGNACGAPSVASDVPGLRDSVRDGQTGLLVPHGDAEALATALLRILDDKHLSRSFAEEGLNWAKRFSWDAVAEDVIQLIEEAINPGSVPPLLQASPF
jgi:glycosyltransferase involved in cell wall biosynthesis